MKHTLFLILLTIAAASCQSTIGESSTGSQFSGYAQKGQLIKGSSITAFALDNNLDPTGESFPANIKDYNGSFSINSIVKTAYVNLRAEGYYFNEITGTISESPIYLEALAKNNDKNVNLNLLTTIIRSRVDKLFQDGIGFDKACDKAQKEFLASFNFPELDAKFNSLDITSPSKADAILLAFTCMAQYGRSAGELTELVNEIASDLETDGNVSAGNVDKVLQNGLEIDIAAVITNFVNYYKEKIISNRSMPSFHRYLDNSYDKDFLFINKDDVITFEETIDVMVLSDVDFSVEPQFNWMKTEVQHVIGPVYNIKCNTEEYKNSGPRDCIIYVKDKNGKVLSQKSMRQENTACIQLYFDFYNYKEGIHKLNLSGTELVIVNNDTLQISPEGKFYAGSSDQYIVVFPADGISGCDLQNRTFTKTYPKECLSTTISTTISSEEIRTPSYCGYQANNGTYMNVVSFDGCLSVDVSKYPETDYIIIKANTPSEVLSGDVEYYIEDGNRQYNTYAIKYSDCSNQVKVKKVKESSCISVTIPRQVLTTGLTITMYDANGTELVTGKNTREFDISKMSYYRL